MNKMPCEYCGNTEYQSLYKYVDGKPFCTRTCLMLWRERKVMDANRDGPNGEHVHCVVRAARSIH